MKDFKNIGVVGAGSMGIGIAQIASTSGCKVFLYDQNVEIAQSALNKLKKILERLIEKKRINSNKRDEILYNIKIYVYYFVDSIYCCTFFMGSFYFF